VGAGPGDPGLLTARALELIGGADVILYDRLIPWKALEGARAESEILFVGKEGGGESDRSRETRASGANPRFGQQEEIEALMVARARAGASVVRLKGGDPFVFGRGGEEALTLRAAGIPFEVVPGVTAGVAAAAYAGIPVTHRDRASAVALITGHEDPEKEESAIDWAALAAFPGTLVFYMGVRRLPRIAQALVEAGRAPSEPAAVIERGTLPAQRTITGTLGTIAERASEAEVRAPSITVVGPVAGLAGELAWLPERPLGGLSVAVTRARAQASGLARTLGNLGARVIEAPVIRTVALPGPPLDPSPYDLVCLTSPNGAHELFQRLAAGGRDARALAGARVAAIGPGTARALREHGVIADVAPERFVAEGLVETLPEALRARGAEVDVLDLYETLAEPLSERALAAAREADYITFTSSSTVSFFLQAAAGETGADGGIGAEAAGLLSPHTRIVSIGPVTSATLREHGLEPHVEAARHDVEGVVAALLSDAAKQAR
jgi:uroporphyrinogen III methyltransferase/synthase